MTIITLFGGEKMTEHKLIPIGVITVALMAVVTITQSAHCQEEEYYCLMIQQSSVDAGIVSPGVGIHQVAVGEPVTLKATPKPGYRFVYWMGDVSDASTSQTIVIVDAPKIVVAVFERTEHELLLEAGDFAGGQGGGGGLVGVGTFISGGGPVSTGGGDFDPPKRIVIPPIKDEPSDPFPVPGDENSIPVPGEDNPIPEPATVVLLGMGGLMLLRRKRC